MAHRKAFLGHAWVGVRFEKGWLFADPTLNQTPSAFGLVPLLIDNNGSGALEVLRLVGCVSVQVD
jgi:hypothetical protein